MLPADGSGFVTAEIVVKEGQETKQDSVSISTDGEFDTEPQNVRVYQALFSDSDVLPWRPRI
jgi:hypothetical protein